MSAFVRKVVYAAPPPVAGAFVWRKEVKGMEKEWGMCPEERPGRGSGSFPENLTHIR